MFLCSVRARILLVGAKLIIFLAEPCYSMPSLFTPIFLYQVKLGYVILIHARTEQRVRKTHKVDTTVFVSVDILAPNVKVGLIFPVFEIENSFFHRFICSVYLLFVSCWLDGVSALPFPYELS